MLAEIPVIMLTIIDDKNFGYMLGAAEYMTEAPLIGAVSRMLQEIPHRPVRPVRSWWSRMRARRDGCYGGHSKNRGGPSSRPGTGEALEQVAAQRPALIVLDLTMPMMDGFRIHAELRQREDWRTIPIVVMTAKDLTSEERQWLHGTVAKVLLKGTSSRDDLLGEVRRLAASRAPGNRRGS